MNIVSLLFSAFILLLVCVVEIIEYFTISKMEKEIYELEKLIDELEKRNKMCEKENPK